MKKMNKKGFTIVELSIVIAVIAILSAALVPTFSGIVKNAKNTAAIQNAQNEYTEYLTNLNIQSGENPDTYMIYKDADDRFVAFKDGNVITNDDGKPFETFDKAIEKLAITLGDYKLVDDENTEKTSDALVAGELISIVKK